MPRIGIVAETPELARRVEYRVRHLLSDGTSFTHLSTARGMALEDRLPDVDLALASCRSCKSCQKST